ncbi:hypothetical protein [Deinococcus alpinitundrae]|uniref:hypothetical protein n=1 Tax=Deinococcus alpinitundrae TaxID=468913 RepID=UPI00137B6B4C|nr:hypothetical protein [Deinococcus alpinitundrae]
MNRLITLGFGRTLLVLTGLARLVQAVVEWRSDVMDNLTASNILVLGVVMGLLLIGWGILERKQFTVGQMVLAGFFFVDCILRILRIY